MSLPNIVILKKLGYVTVSLLFFWVTGCSDEQKPKEKPPKPVKAMIVPSAKHNQVRSFSGKVIASEEATLSFEVPGKLNSLTVLEGSILKKGEVIASIDPSHYQEKLNEAKAQFELAKAQFERAQQLIKKHFISQSDYDLLKSKNDISAATLASRQKDLKDTELKAPFDGVVAKKYVDNYEYVKAKQPIVLLQDLSQIDIEIFVPEYIILQMKSHTKLNSMVYFAAVDKKYPVTLKEFSTQAEPSTQTYKAVFTLKAPTEINILPGMSVNIELTIPDFRIGQESYYLIPSSAVFSNADGKSAVWVIDPKTNTIHMQEIVTVDLSNHNIKVLKGIRQGQMIVIAGVHYLRDGQKVKPLEMDENGHR